MEQTPYHAINHEDPAHLKGLRHRRIARLLGLNLVYLLLLLSQPAFASITPYENCIYVLLAKGCVISGDPDAPKFMTDQGAAACFVGSDITRNADLKTASVYSSRIIKNNLDRASHESLIKKIQQCVSDPDRLDSCSYAKTMRVEDIKSCKAFLNQPKLNLRISSHGLKSDGYEFALGDNWKLVNERIYPDKREFTFIMDDAHRASIVLSNEIGKSQLAEIKDALRKNVNTIFEPEGIEKISYKTVSIGKHQDLDELVFYRHNKIKVTFAQYYIFGNKHLAILSYSTLGKHPDITHQSRKIVKKLILK